MKTKPLSEAYEATMRPIRGQILDHETMRAMLDPTIEPRVIERFLIEYCAWGVQITEPVERWIRRAGERCIELGLAAVGSSLVAHARHEAGHHELFISDTRVLVARWNSRTRDALDPDALMARAATPAMQRYIELHERNIEGATPYAQVAIEYEIEGLAVSIVPKMLEQFVNVLGKEVLDGLSFMTTHAELDIGHTSQNQRMLETLLQAKSDAVEALVIAGEAALWAYLDFFGECMARAVSTGSGRVRDLAAG